MLLLKRAAPPVGLTTGHSRLILSINLTFFLLATIAVLLRVYARHIKRVSFVSEDYSVFAALLGFFAQAVLTCCAVIYGAAGHPQSEVSLQNVKASLQILAGQGVCYGVAMTCSKWSICLLYQRIFILRSFRIATYAVMVLIFGWGLLAFTVTWALCEPIAYGWDVTIPGGHCANRDAAYLVVGIVDAVTDFLILILPLPIIWRLQIPKVKQVSLMVIFGIAVFTFIVSAMRAYYTTLVTFDDFTDSRTLLDVFSAIEPATSIIVASSLVLGPVIKRWFRGGSISGSDEHHSFRRIEEKRPVFVSDDLENGHTETAVQGPGRTEDNKFAKQASEVTKDTSGVPRAHVKGDAAGIGGIIVQREFLVQEWPWKEGVVRTR